jgi:hypothetical protein
MFTIKRFYFLVTLLINLKCYGVKKSNFGKKNFFYSLSTQQNIQTVNQVENILPFDEIDSQTIKDVLFIEASGLFSKLYYKEKYMQNSNPDADPIDHYCQVGWQKGCNPNVWFNTKEVQKILGETNKNPFVTYIFSNCKLNIYDTERINTIKCEVINLIKDWPYALYFFPKKTTYWSLPLDIEEKKPYLLLNLNMKSQDQVALYKGKGASNHYIESSFLYANKWLFENNHLYFLLDESVVIDFFLLIFNQTNENISYLGRFLRSFGSPGYYLLIRKKI